MNKLFFLLAGIPMIALTIACSEKIDTPQSIDKKNETVLTVKLDKGLTTKVVNGDTKSNPNSNTRENDARIDSWSVFVFDEGDANKVLVAGAEGINGNDKSTSLTVKQYASVSVYVVANHSFSNAPQTKAALETELAFLAQESYEAFTMVGQQIVSASKAETSADVTLSRMVSRIKVKEISVDFKENPALKNKAITDMEIYIKNAPTTMAMGMNADGTKFANNGLDEQNGQSYSFASALIPEALKNTEASVADKHKLNEMWFHCYQKNFTQAPGATDSPVRLIVKGTLNGKTQYWGFDINCQQHDTTGDNDAYGISSNYIYEISMKITNFGADSEDANPAFNSFTTSIEVADWTTIDLGEVEY